MLSSEHSEAPRVPVSGSATGWTRRRGIVDIRVRRAPGRGALGHLLGQSGGAGPRPCRGLSQGGPDMRTIETDGAPAHTGPVPQAVEVDGWLFVSALFGVDPKTGQRPDSAEAEAEQLF